MPSPTPDYSGTTKQPPLVVDLDRSLICVDLLHEALLRHFLHSPLSLIFLAFRHRHSLASFKTSLALEVPVDAANLPYEPRVLAHLREEFARNRRLILATASPAIWADAVAKHFGIFSNVLATDSKNNLKKAAKITAIRNLLGDEHFAYIGDSSDDIPLFEAAAGGRMLVGSASRPLTYLQQSGLQFEHLAPAGLVVQCCNAFYACRPQHWIKNTLIFLPAITSWGMYPSGRLLPAFGAFFSFSLVASAVYLINDIADLAADRAHPDKCRRPLAAGLLPVSKGIALASFLFIVGLGLAFSIDPNIAAVLVAYVTLNAAYTARLKEMPLTDIALLSCFYLIRVILGLYVLGLPRSIWFIAFLGCLFAELAHWKRYVEVINNPPPSSKRRSYTSQDANILLAFGVGFSFSAALILVLYLRSNEVSPAYRSPAALAVLAPILLLHNLGMWLEASRDNGTSDPVTYVLKSRKFWVAAVAAVMVLAYARLFPIP